MSYAFGNFITEANIDGKGWRWVFWIAAIPGFVVALLIIFTVKEPQREEGGQTARVRAADRGGSVNSFLISNCGRSTTTLQSNLTLKSLILKSSWFPFVWTSLGANLVSPFPYAPPTPLTPLPIPPPTLTHSTHTLPPFLEDNFMKCFFSQRTFDFLYEFPHSRRQKRSQKHDICEYSDTPPAIQGTQMSQFPRRGGASSPKCL